MKGKDEEVVTYDFDTPVERRGTDSLKFDSAEAHHRSPDLLSLWVADMDFRTPDEVVDAIVERTQHGIFGYTEPGLPYYRSVANWMYDRHNWTVDAGWIALVPGVVCGLATAVRAYTEPGDAVLIQPPVYYPFGSVIRENGRVVAEAPLVYAGAGGAYSIDFDAFERALAESGAKLFFLCNPHNPVGRVWRMDELRRLGEICLAHDVIIVSDEIHMDFVRPGHVHVPMASLSPRISEATVTLTSASKTFNLAGLQLSNAIIPNKRLRARFKEAAQAGGYGMGNTLGLTATKAAYDHGAPWLDALLAYLEGNWTFLREFLEARIPELKLVEAEGTYLAWVDCRALGMDDGRLKRFILDDAKLWLDQGDMFGSQGSGFIRINIATQKAYLERALLQLEAAVATRCRG